MNVLKISKRAIFASLARVAKLVDALSSGGSIRKVVLVRIQSRAQKNRSLILRFFYLEYHNVSIRHSLFTIYDHTLTLKSLNASFKLVLRSVLGLRWPMINAQPTPNSPAGNFFV